MCKSVIKSLKYHRFCEKIADFLVLFGILLYLCHRQIIVTHVAWAMMTPEITSGIIYADTSETCQRSHYTISGGTPVELHVLATKSTYVWRQGRLPLSLSLGE